MAVFHLIDQLSAALDNNMFAISIFLDISKAFDTVDHNIILSKLHLYVFQDVVFKWFDDYFRNREQYVCISGHSSNRTWLFCGIPQGLILRLFLFLIYINDFAIMSVSTISILFADDTNIVVTHSDFGSLIREANTILTYASRWFQMNKLSVILSNKTKHLKAEAPDRLMCISCL